MAKMYFVDTNGGYLTVAVAELPGINITDFRACYMWQDGREGNYPCNNPRWDDAGVAGREEIATAWLKQLAECNDFESLYSDCDCYSGFRGVYTAGEFWRDIATGDDILAEIDF